MSSAKRPRNAKMNVVLPYPYENLQLNDGEQVNLSVKRDSSCLRQARACLVMHQR